MHAHRPRPVLLPVLAPAVILAFAVGALVGVGTISAAGAGSARIQVVTSFFPLAEVAAAVGGGAVSVRNLTPPGVEPHDLELTPDDRDAIEDADLVIVLGGGFQPAIEEAADRRDGPTLDLATTLRADDRARVRHDPHLWLDPVKMQRVEKAIERELFGVAVHDVEAITRRGSAYRLQLSTLDAEFEAGLARCERQLFVTAHGAFGWLARQYGLREEGIAGIDPESEPGPERIADLTDLVERTGTTTVFTEDLVSTNVADTLAREAGVRTATLSPLEGLTEQQQRRGATYFSVMRANLEKLRTALDCS